MAENHWVWECGKCCTPRVVIPTSIHESIFDHVGCLRLCFEKNPHHVNMVALRGKRKGRGRGLPGQQGRSVTNSGRKDWVLEVVTDISQV